MMLSFVVPMLNGESTIERCIRSIQNQKTDLAFEIVVIDNGCSDSSPSIARSLGVEVYFEPKRGRSYARNAGIQRARGKWIAFIDCDVELDPHWVSSTSAYLEEDYFDCFQGKIFPGSDHRNWFSQFREKVISRQTHGSFCSLEGIKLVAPLCNSAACVIRASSLKEINGFDPEIPTYEDQDLSWRLWKKGAKFCVVPQAFAKVYWDKGTIVSYFVRSFQMGRGFSMFAKKWSYFSHIFIAPDCLFPQNMAAVEKIAYFLLQFSFALGFRTPTTFDKREIPLRKCLDLVFLFVSGKDVIWQLSPFVRLVCRSNEVVFKNIKTARERVIPFHGTASEELLASLVSEHQAALRVDCFLLHSHKR